MKLRVEYIPRPYKGKVYRYPFVVTSYRNEKGVPAKKVLCNLSHLPEYVVKLIKRALDTGEEGMSLLVGTGEVKLQNAMDFGHIYAAYHVAKKLKIVESLEVLPEKHRLPVLAMILDRVTGERPHSKRALCSMISSTPLPLLEGQDQIPPLHEWYKALESLLESQEAIEKKLFKKGANRIFLYDITSSYFEGVCCPLAKYGYDRDNKKGKVQIVIGLLCNEAGRPLCVRVFEGNTKDDTTVLEQVKRLKSQFGLEEVVFVGDRGMVTSKRIEELETNEFSWVKYITALRRRDMMKLVEDTSHPIQLGLFDERGLAEVVQEGKRYILCCNPLRKAEDKAVREALLEKTESKLEMIRRNVDEGRWKKKEVIARHLYRWLDRWGMEGFYEVEYGEGVFRWRRREEEIERFRSLDGCYVIVTNLKAEEMEKEEVVSRYKSLAVVEQAWRVMKTTEIEVRPIRHWNPERVKGHVFVCMLSYLILWEVRRRLEPILERDPETRKCEGGSLREIWEKLRQIKLGTFKVGPQEVKDLTPLTPSQKKILQLLGASLTKKAKQAILNL